MKQNIIIMLLGFILFVLVRRKQQPIVVRVQMPPTPTPVPPTPPAATQPAEPHKDRSLEELSSTYAQLIKSGGIYTYPLDQAYTLIREFVDEFLRSDLTLVERERVKEKLTGLFQYGLLYEMSHQQVLERQTDDWLDSVEEEAL